MKAKKDFFNIYSSRWLAGYVFAQLYNSIFQFSFAVLDFTGMARDIESNRVEAITGMYRRMSDMAFDIRHVINDKMNLLSFVQMTWDPNVIFRFRLYHMSKDQRQFAMFAFA